MLLAVALVEMFFALASGESYSISSTQDFCNEMKLAQETYAEEGKTFTVVLADENKILKDVTNIFCIPASE
jgi:hypothetical protein